MKLTKSEKEEIVYLFALGDILAFEFMQKLKIKDPLLQEVINLNINEFNAGRDPGDSKEYFNKKIKLLKNLGIVIS